MIQARWLQRSSHPFKHGHRQAIAASLTGRNVCVITPDLVHTLLMDPVVLLFSRHILPAKLSYKTTDTVGAALTISAMAVGRVRRPHGCTFRLQHSKLFAHCQYATRVCCTFHDTTLFRERLSLNFSRRHHIFRARPSIRTHGILERAGA